MKRKKKRRRKKKKRRKRSSNKRRTFKRKIFVSFKKFVQIIYNTIKIQYNTIQIQYNKNTNTKTNIIIVALTPLSFEAKLTVETNKKIQNK